MFCSAPSHLSHVLREVGDDDRAVVFPMADLMDGGFADGFIEFIWSSLSRVYYLTLMVLSLLPKLIRRHFFSSSITTDCYFLSFSIC